MHTDWRRFLQGFYDEHFQVEEVCDRFVTSGVFSTDQRNTIVDVKKQQDKIIKFYETLQLFDDDILDLFIQHLEYVKNAQLAEKLRAGIVVERERQAKAEQHKRRESQRQRATTDTTVPSHVTSQSHTDSVFFPSPQVPSTPLDLSNPGNSTSETDKRFDRKTNFFFEQADLFQGSILQDINKRQSQVTENINPSHAKLLGGLLLPPAEGSPKPNERTRYKRWLPGDRQKLRNELMRTFDRYRYCEESIKDSLTELFSDWLVSEKTQAVLPVLFIGPNGTGKHKMMEAIAKNVLRCDCIQDFNNFIENKELNSKEMNVLISLGVQSPHANDFFDSPQPGMSKQCEEFSRLIADRQQKLALLFKSDSSPRLIHAVIQDTDGMYEQKELSYLDRRHQFGSNYASATLMSFERKRYFGSFFFNIFPSRGIFVFKPVESQLEQIKLVARDLNRASIQLERKLHQDRLQAVRKLIQDEREPKTFVKLFTAANIGQSLNPSGSFHPGYRLKVEFFKQYDLSLIDNIKMFRKSKSKIRRYLSNLYCAKTEMVALMNEAERIDHICEEDVQMLEQLRRRILQSGTFSKRCYKVVVDLLHDLLSNQSDRLVTCDFVVKLQSIAGELQFGLLDPKQQQYHHGARTRAPFSTTPTNEDMYDTTSNRTLYNRLSGSLHFRGLNCLPSSQRESDVQPPTNPS